LRQTGCPADPGAVSPTPPPAATPSPVPAGDAAESGGGPDILLVALTTTGVIAGPAILGLLVRVRRPPSNGGGPAEES